jgi:hypothetical protein
MSVTFTWMLVCMGIVRHSQAWLTPRPLSRNSASTGSLSTRTHVVSARDAATTGSSTPRHLSSATLLHSSTTSTSLHMSSSYVPPEKSDLMNSPVSSYPRSTKRSLHPQVGDLVRYYELDGGNEQGQVLVGRITFVQKVTVPAESSSSNTAAPTTSSTCGWLLELTPLDDVGEGYFADYPARKRQRIWRDGLKVSPIAASWVRNEGAWKVPLTTTKTVAVKAEQYDWEDYEGPFTGDRAINLSVVQADGILYETLKAGIFKSTALTGLAGTVIADWVQGPEVAAIYGGGVVASLLYLFFLSLKTDTVGSTNAKFGNNLSNVRFLMPLLLMVFVALYNQSLGDANPVGTNAGLLTRITPTQFAAATLGFLTYRIPLLITQIKDALQDSDSKSSSSDSSFLPGSAGVALQLVQDATSSAPASTSSATEAALTTVLLISGPQATGRSDLVQAFLASKADDTRFVTPQRIDRNQQGATWDRLEQRGELVSVDPSGRYGITEQGIVQAAAVAASSANDNKSNAVVVMDADIALAQRLTQMAGLRLIGVWVGLNSVQAFEERLNAMVDAGELVVGEEETREGVVRGKIKEIIKEIEYGLSSGIFEFTILNEDPKQSLKQLQEASTYCFK